MDAEVSRHPRSTPTGARPQVVLAEGFFGEVFNSLSSGAFLTGLARELGAGAVGLSLIMALPALAQLAQCFAVRLQRTLRSFRAVVVPCTLTRLLWLIPALMPALGFYGRCPLCLAMVVLFALTSLGMIATHSWTAWMADIVEPGERTRLFGRRTSAVSMATLLVAPAGALLLDHNKGTPREALSYALLGVVAVTAGLVGSFMHRRLPDAVPHPSSCAHLTDFVAELPKRRSYVRILVFFALWACAIGLPAPFWSLYMLETLHMSFLLICLHDAMLLLVRLLCSGWWSRTIERVGTQRVLTACALVIALNPLIWLLPSPARYWPVWCEAIFGGIFWTGFNQAAFIHPLLSLQKEERGYGLAVLNLATGVTQFLASILGGLVMKAVGDNLMFGYETLFILSASLRALAGLLAVATTEPHLARWMMRRLRGHSLRLRNNASEPSIS